LNVVDLLSHMVLAAIAGVEARCQVGRHDEQDTRIAVEPARRQFAAPPPAR